MGLLRKAELRRKELLERLTKEKKLYIDHVSKKRKDVLHEGIKKERVKVKKAMKKRVKKKPKLKPKIDIKKLKREIREELIKKPLKEIVVPEKPIKRLKEGFVRTGIKGLDDLFEEGIPRGASVLIAGGTGAGKTILALQTVAHHASKGRKCLYMSFEESEDHLIQHMESFGWKPKGLIKKGKLLIRRFNPFDITRSVDALLMKAKGELLIEVEPIILPKGFKPDFVVVDSLTAIASAFTQREESYRIYIEQLFRFLEKIDATSFLVTETKQIPDVFSQSGVEEFLADGVIVLYHIKRGDIRENAIEVLKLRGAKHQKRIVAMQVTDKGIVVYPKQQVFGGVEEE